MSRRVTAHSLSTVRLINKAFHRYGWKTTVLGSRMDTRFPFAFPYANQQYGALANGFKPLAKDRLTRVEPLFARNPSPLWSSRLTLNIRYYHQDLHLRRLHTGLCRCFTAQRSAVLLHESSRLVRKASARCFSAIHFQSNWLRQASRYTTP